MTWIQKIFVIVCSIFGVFLFFLAQPKEEIVKTKFISFDIKGAVKHPGVYQMEEGKTVMDAINASGGLLDTTDTSTLNLSKTVLDGNVIILYTKDEIEQMRKENTNIKIIEQDCICPILKQDACITDSITNFEEKKEGAISLNKATLEQLMSISGIGEQKARAILEYREQHGGFQSIEEIMEVNGIGASTFAKIKDFLIL